MKRAVIIGAGYGGIALANLLARDGYQVDVFEKNSTPGGRIAVARQDGFTFDIGPSWYLMPEVFERYYGYFGASAMERLDLQRLSPGYRVFFENDEPITIQGAVEQDADTFESIESGAGNKLRRYVADSAHTYEVALRHFLYTNFDRLSDLLSFDVLRNAPRMLALATRPLDTLVRRSFTDSRLQRILEYHMVFLGSSPYAAPALYSLMSTLDFNSGVFYPKAGMYKLVEDLIALGDSEHITYHYDSEVTAILSEGRTATGIGLANGSVHMADLVVSAADLHFTETALLPRELQTYPDRYWRRRQPGPSGFVVALGIKGQLPQLLHHNLYFVDDWKGNFSAIYDKKVAPDHASMYVCNPSKSDPSLAPAGAENLFILVPFPSGVRLSADATETLAHTYVETFAHIIGEDDLEDRIMTRFIMGPADFERLYRAWEYNAFGGESHILGQSALFRTKNKSSKLDNLYYTGAGTLPGIGLPMCLISAEQTYKRITGIKRGGPLV